MQTLAYQRPYRIFIDMDGVLSKCHEAALREFGMNIEADEWPMGRWVQSLIIGDYRRRGEQAPMYCWDRREFWGRFPYKFWVDIPLHDFAKPLVEYCRSCAGDNCFLFSKPTGVASWSGKARWVADHFPDLIQDNLVLGQRKEIAAPGSLLIDDSKSNCQKFIQEGGQAVFVERPWNGHPNTTWDNLKEAVAEVFVS